MDKWQLHDIEPNTCSIKPKIVEIYEYFNSLGYAAVKDENKFELYYLIENFVYDAFDKDLIDELKNFFRNPETAPEPYETEKGVKKPYKITIDAKHILEKITAYKFGNIINEANHTFLTRLELDFLRHDRETSYFYFNDAYVKITKDKIEKCLYEHTKQHILAEKVIEHDIDIINNLDQYTTVGARGAKFHDFLKKICLTPYNKEVHNESDLVAQNQVDGIEHVVDKDKYKYLTELIGYLLHDKRIKGATDFCVIFCDDDSGGSGKGLLGQALAQLTLVAEVDGKKKRTEHDQNNLTKNTRIKIYNDIPKNFDFEMVYNEVTDSGTVRHMYKDPVSIPYNEMWKVLILTNYIVKSSAGHSKRRQKVFELFPFFNDKNRVQEFYKHSFFSEDWEVNDWNYFYNLMFQNVQAWLKTDYKINYDNSDYTNRLIFETYSPELIDYIENLNSPDGWYDTGELFANFVKAMRKLIDDGKPIDNYIKDNLMTSSNLFGRKLRSYCSDKGYVFVKTKDRSKVRILKSGQNTIKQAELRFELNSPDQVNMFPQ